MPQLTFKGIVYTGKGEGKKFITLPWVKSQIEQKLLFTPYAGTLNLHLTKEGAEQKRLLEKAKRLEILPKEGYCKGTLIKASIGTIESAIIIPEIPTYPKDVLEIISAWNLRKKLKLKDGSEVAVTVALQL